MFSDLIWAQNSSNISALFMRVGLTVVALVVLGRWAGLGRMAVMVSITVRSRLSCSPGPADAGAARSAPVRDLDLFVSLINIGFFNITVFTAIRLRVVLYGMIFLIGRPVEELLLPKGNHPKMNKIKLNHINLSCSSYPVPCKESSLFLA